LNVSHRIGEIRHLLYHLYPHKKDDGAIWRRNIDDLLKRISLFNGKRIMGVATSRETDSLDTVQAAVQGHRIELIRVQNIKEQRETTTLLKLYERVAHFTGPEHVTLHAHGKGISSEAWATGSRTWSQALYELYLDYWPRVELMLQGLPIVGACKRIGSAFKMPRFTSSSKWHYSGAWRWFRNSDLFARNWRTIEPFWCGSETHPSMIFTKEEAGNLAIELPPDGKCLYLQEYWDSTAGPELQKFREENESYRQEPLLLTCIITSHRKPQRVHEAIQSVLRQSCPDWQLIVIDSGDLVEELQRYEADPRVRVIPTNETPELRASVGIQSWAINECYRRGYVYGDLCCYLCDDDRYHPEAFGCFFSAARANPDQSAWCGKADILEMRPDGTSRKTGQLGTHPIGTLLDCKCDGMQVCHRRDVDASWNEDKAEAWHADGMFLRDLADETDIHPLTCTVGEHRHTPESTFTRTAAKGTVSNKAGFGK
jgi:Glycosyl transferase family 2